mmetsp:Transcript_30373/g.85679  ORF Transcript_30373/g.85679 Transcript_30373/m.85679 type:complete len:353 (+) Transcript_30373:694-1752(+)
MAQENNVASGTFERLSMLTSVMPSSTHGGCQAVRIPPQCASSPVKTCWKAVCFSSCVAAMIRPAASPRAAVVISRAPRWTNSMVDGVSAAAAFGAPAPACTWGALFGAAPRSSPRLSSSASQHCPLPPCSGLRLARSSWHISVLLPGTSCCCWPCRPCDNISSIRGWRTAPGPLVPAWSAGCCLPGCCPQSSAGLPYSGPAPVRAPSLDPFTWGCGSKDRSPFCGDHASGDGSSHRMWDPVKTSLLSVLSSYEGQCWLPCPPCATDVSACVKRDAAGDAPSTAIRACFLRTDGSVLPPSSSDVLFKSTPWRFQIGLPFSVCAATGLACCCCCSCSARGLEQGGGLALLVDPD